MKYTKSGDVLDCELPILEASSGTDSFRIVKKTYKNVIPAPAFAGVNCGWNPVFSMALWIPVPRFHEDKLHGNDSFEELPVFKLEARKE
jgi:hypothetical protein